MERVQTLFREGVLSHLEQLESLSHNLAVKQQQSRREEEILQEKRDAIVRLQREKDELQTRIKLQKEEIQALTVKEEASGPAGPCRKEALQEMRVEEMKSVMEALWFTGISGKMTDNGVCFCISTAFEGTYLDSYYLQVDKLENPRIVRHSVPPFIPLGEIAKTHLQANLKKFLSVLFDHLNGYAGRLHQADQLQRAESTYVSGTLKKNSLCTVLSFSYYASVAGRMSSFSAKLLYGDVIRTLPTEALIICSDTSASRQDTIEAHSSLFCSKALISAVESVGSSDANVPSVPSSVLGV
ncbi:centromere protein O [Mixophyes fleayi]|uniref:centromere protein O n=1 Tax=Mixophyes fleayi TaxID=3061075 RepID=UPI003F4D9651